MRYRITQTNEYQYSRFVNHSINQLRLSPFTDEGQSCQHFELDLSVSGHCYTYQDYFGNNVIGVYVHEPHRDLSIRTIAEVDVQPSRACEDNLSRSTIPPAQVGEADRRYHQRYAEFLAPTNYTTLHSDEQFAPEAGLFRHQPDILTYAGELSSLLFHHFKYRQGSTTVATTAADFLRSGQGVCQDYAHLMLALCRRRGIPTRYVSGYLYCGEDAALRGDAAMHAWVEIHVRGLGWIGFDPTNNVQADERYIRIATGRDYTDIVPMKGVVSGGGTQRFSGSVSVQRVLPQT